MVAKKKEKTAFSEKDIREASSFLVAQGVNAQGSLKMLGRNWQGYVNWVVFAQSTGPEISVRLSVHKASRCEAYEFPWNNPMPFPWNNH